MAYFVLCTSIAECVLKAFITRRAVSHCSTLIAFLVIRVCIFVKDIQATLESAINV